MLPRLAEYVLFVQYGATAFCWVFFFSKLCDLISRVVTFANSPNVSKCIQSADKNISGTVGLKTLCSIWFEHKYVEQSVPICERIRNNLVIISNRY